MKSKQLVLVLVAVCMLGVGVRAEDALVTDLVAQLKSTDEAARLRAIDELALLGPQAADAVAPLTDLLTNESAKVRAHAAWTLGAIGEPAKSAVPAMAELLKDKDATVRRQVAKALRYMRPGPKVMIPLCVKLLEDPDPAVRAKVLQAITETGAKAVPGLIEALNNDKADYWALIILREIGPEAKAAVPALVAKLKDSRPEIRREVVLTLGAMGDGVKEALPKIAELLTDEHVRTAATFVLGEVGQFPQGAEETVRANAKSDDRLLATVSLWALARVHPDDKELRREAGEQLIARLKDENAFVRQAAAKALAALPPAPEIMGPIWEKALQNADEMTKRHALDALATLGAPAVPRLIDLLKQEKLRVQVIYILGRIGPDAAPATEALAQLLGDKHSRVVHEAIMALGNIGPGAKAAVGPLTKALQGDDDDNFGAIAYALGRIGPAAAEAKPALARLAQGKDYQVAVLCAWALVQIDPACDEAGQNVPLLTQALSQPRPQARLLALDALKTLGAKAKAASAAVQAVTKDPNEDVREAAEATLKAIGS